MKMKFIFLISIFLHQVIFLYCTNRPIVGILSQEFRDFGEEFYPATNYIAASYVKAVEAAGARVVPIFIKQNFSYYKNLLHSINGVILPGGLSALLQPHNGYYDAASLIYKLAKQINDQGTFFPILGVCLGFEALLIISNNNVDMRTRCNVFHENYPLIFSNDFRQSLMYANLPQELYVYLKYLDVTKNDHWWCITRANFTKHKLDKEWQVTATNLNMRGLEFISSAEHKRYPFLAVQFHPEKAYEWASYQKNPHSKNAILANRYFYDMFVSLTRLNENAFRKVRDERQALIYNYYPRMMKSGSVFEQIYLFT